MDFIIVMVVLLSAILLVMLLCAWFLRYEKKRAEAANQKGMGFDERQVGEQAKAGEFAFVVAGIYFLIVYFLLSFWDLQHIEPIVKPATLIFGGIWLMMLSNSIYCLMTDALVPMDNGPIPATGSIVCGVLIMLGAVIGTDFFREPLFGEDSYRLEQLLYGVALLTLGIVKKIARSRSERETE